MIEAAVFDLDGTLVDLPIDYEKLFKTFQAIMHMENVRPLVDTISKVDEETRQRVFEAWDEAELACSAKISINKEGMEIYKKFAHKPKALVTMQGKKIAEIIVEYFGLSFVATFTREDSLDRTKQLEKAAEALKTSFQNILFVGDSENDKSVAQKLGCEFFKIK
jgi:HAD superfamily hydrolase (TIGR01549 family)